MKYFLLLLISLLAVNVRGQNIFPNPGNVGIGTNQPLGQLQIKGSPAFDASTRLYLTNNASMHGRTNFILTGRFQNGNDAWSFGSNARNSIVFAQNSESENGVTGTEKYSIQLEGNSNSLGFLSSARGNAPSMILTQSGNIGVGTTNPTAILDIGSDIGNGALGTVFGRLLEGNTTGDGTFLGVRGYATQGASATTIKSFALEHSFYGIINSSINFFRGGGQSGGFLTFNTDNNNEKMRITTDGLVGIGTTSPDSKLTVKGKIHAEEVKVDLNVPGPDYVFESKYALKPLSQVETFITQNKHLPEIPSAKAMKEEGINVGEMQMNLLKKIEELTLYLIEQKKEITSLKQEVAALKK